MTVLEEQALVALLVA